ncbi:MAG: transposase DNA-binding-containing protein [Noviherbaspirillum sp.]
MRPPAERLWTGIGNTIPLVCQGWGSTTGAYRCFSNERVTRCRSAP